MTSNHRALDGKDIELIESVKHTPSLYDPQNPDFKLTYRKEENWENIATKLNISQGEARRRWTCLRDRYSRELKQQRLHPEKGYGKNSFFRQMDFLCTFVRKRKSRRRNNTYDITWDHTLDSTIMEDKNMISSDCMGNEMDFDEGQEEQKHNYPHNRPYNVKVDISSTRSNTTTYSELVEDTSEFDYIEPQITENSNSSNTIKCNNNSIAATSSKLPDKTYTIKHEHPYFMHSQKQSKPQPQPQPQPQEIKMNPNVPTDLKNEAEDDFFCKSLAVYLKQLSRRHKIKAKVEIFQVVEKYIDIEENERS